MMEDYRKNVKASLSVMQMQRLAVYQDVKRHYSALYNGLHEQDSEKVRALYFEAYHLEWLDLHWEKLAQMMQHSRKKEQQDMAAFFAVYFSELMQNSAGNGMAASIAAPELLRAQLTTVKQLIECSDQWDEKNNQMQVNLKKHKAHYKKLIERAKAAGKENENGVS